MGHAHSKAMDAELCWLSQLSDLLHWKFHIRTKFYWPVFCSRSCSTRSITKSICRRCFQSNRLGYWCYCGRCRKCNQLSIRRTYTSCQGCNQRNWKYFWRNWTISKRCFHFICYWNWKQTQWSRIFRRHHWFQYCLESTLRYPRQEYYFLDPVDSACPLVDIRFLRSFLRTKWNHESKSELNSRGTSSLRSIKSRIPIVVVK